MKLPFVLARRFVAGETAARALVRVEELNRKNIHATMDLLGEEVRDRGIAAETVDSYIGLLGEIGESGLKSTISVKLTMMGLLIDETFCRDNLFRLLDEAVRLNQFVRIDMESSRYTRATLDLFSEAMGRYGRHVGIVIQASLHRSADDIPALARAGADVRLCKGAYREPPEIALQKMPAIREAFMSYAGILLEQTSFPRFATHDDRLLGRIKLLAQELGLDKSRYEFQMLYGLREDTMTALAAEGYRTRIYVPYGTMWFPYFRRRLTERKENVWFVLANLFRS